MFFGRVSQPQHYWRFDLNNSLSWWDHPVYCRMVNSSPPLDASSTPPSGDNPKCLQTSLPNVPWLRTTALEQITLFLSPSSRICQFPLNPLDGPRPPQSLSHLPKQQVSWLTVSTALRFCIVLPPKGHPYILWFILAHFKTFYCVFFKMHNLYFISYLCLFQKNIDKSIRSLISCVQEPWLLNFDARSSIIFSANMYVSVGILLCIKENEMIWWHMIPMLPVFFSPSYIY